MQGGNVEISARNRELPRTLLRGSNSFLTSPHHLPGSRLRPASADLADEMDYRENPIFIGLLGIILYPSIRLYYIVPLEVWATLALDPEITELEERRVELIEG